MDILIEAGYEVWQSLQLKTTEMNLRDLKKNWGREIAFWGGINIETLHQGNLEEVEKEILAALKEGAPGGGFILGTSNTVAFGTPLETYLKALATWQKFG